MVGEWNEQRRWEGVRFLPLAGVWILEEHRIEARQTETGFLFAYMSEDENLAWLTRHFVLRW